MIRPDAPARCPDALCNPRKHALCHLRRPDARNGRPDSRNGRPDARAPECEILAFLCVFVCCSCFVSIFSYPNDELSLLCCVLETVIIVKA